MNLKVFVPEEVLLEASVTKIVAEAPNGSFCLLPRHVDFTAALVPGILKFDVADGEEQFIAVDEGTLVKCGPDVLVATRRAFAARDLEELQATVRENFRRLDDQQKKVRTAVARLEIHFVKRFLELTGHGTAGL